MESGCDGACNSELRFNQPWMLVNEKSQIRAKTDQRRKTGESPSKGRP